MYLFTPFIHLCVFCRVNIYITSYRKESAVGLYIYAGLRNRKLVTRLLNTPLDKEVWKGGVGRAEGQAQQMRYSIVV